MPQVFDSTYHEGKFERLVERLPDEDDFLSNVSVWLTTLIILLHFYINSISFISRIFLLYEKVISYVAWYFHLVPFALL